MNSLRAGFGNLRIGRSLLAFAIAAGFFAGVQGCWHDHDDDHDHGRGAAWHDRDWDHDHGHYYHDHDHDHYD